MEEMDPDLHFDRLKNIDNIFPKKKIMEASGYVHLPITIELLSIFNFCTHQKQAYLYLVVMQIFLIA